MSDPELPVCPDCLKEVDFLHEENGWSFYECTCGHTSYETDRVDGDDDDEEYPEIGYGGEIGTVDGD